MKRGLRWLAVLFVAAAVDLGVRFGPGLDFENVLWIEALIFLAAAGVLYRWYRMDPATPGWRRALQAVLLASLVLAAIRAGIWASGQPVTLANGVILGLGVAGWLIWMYRRRARRAAAVESSATSRDPPEETASET